MHVQLVTWKNLDNNYWIIIVINHDVIADSKNKKETDLNYLRGRQQLTKLTTPNKMEAFEMVLKREKAERVLFYFQLFRSLRWRRLKQYVFLIMTVVDWQAR